MSTPAPSIDLLERWRSVLDRIAAASARAGRPPPVLVGVTKSVPAALAGRLLAAGQLDLAENRVQALEAKVRELGAAPARWHLIGHLQSNKARRAVALCDSIHSVDSVELLERLDTLAGELGRSPNLYIEVDSVGDGTRSGVPAHDVPRLVQAAARLSHLRLRGLMTLAPLPRHAGDTDGARQAFAALRRCASGLDADRFVDGRVRLSMGMSSDFEVAIEEGSDVVRVGSALFEGVEARP